MCYEVYAEDRRVLPPLELVVGLDLGNCAPCRLYPELKTRKLMIRSNPCMSWFCPHCSRRLGRSLERRLATRLYGLRTVFVTLTVDPKRFPGGPAEAFEFFKRNRSVARALNTFCKGWGFSSVGAWISKLEITQAGWVHFHAIVIIPDSVELPKRGAMDAYWEHGFSNVQQSYKLSYLVKYAAKPGAQMEHAIRLSGLPAKGLRFITASRGFWGESRPMREESESERIQRTYRSADREVLPDWVTDSECVDESLKLDAAAEHIVRVETCGAHTRVSLFDGCGERVCKQVVVPVDMGTLMDGIGRATGLHWEDGDVVLNDAEWQQALVNIGLPESEYTDNVYLFLQRVDHGDQSIGQGESSGSGWAADN